MKSLRSLAVEIMFNTGADKLLQVNNAVDSVKSNAIEAAGNMDELTQSTMGFGDKVKGFGSGIADNWLAITGAGLAIGGAMVKLTNKANDLNEGLRRVELQSDATEKELREMILGMTDETSDRKGYVNTLEELIKMGVSTREEFEKILPVFDTFGTATNKDMTEGLSAMEAVLSALDIPLSESAEHIDTLTWLTTGTTVSMGDLGRTMRREQANIRGMGLSFDEIAVAMSALEAEGVKGPRAIMAFQTAIQDAEGDAQAFWEGLGVGTDVLENQNIKLLESSGLTEAMADANSKSNGLWDKAKDRIDKAMWSLGSFIEPAKDLGPVLMGVGPATKMLSSGISFMKGPLLGATKATLKFSAALLTNPLTWVAVGIGAVVAGIALLWKNWDDVSAFLGEKWDWIKEKFGGFKDAAVDWGRNIIDGFIGGIKEKRDNAINTVNEFAGGVAGKFKSFFGISSPSKLMMEYGGDITQGLVIGMDEDIPEIPTPEFGPFDMPEFPTPRDNREPKHPRPVGGFGNLTFNPQIEIKIEGDADGQDIRQELEKYFPTLMDDFFDMLAIRMG